jgi:hypothetical protein
MARSEGSIPFTRSLPVPKHEAVPKGSGSQPVPQHEAVPNGSERGFDSLHPLPVKLETCDRPL